MPPTRATAEVPGTSSGMTKVSAATLGKMIRTVREMPMVASASISSVTRLDPRSGPSSRRAGAPGDQDHDQDGAKFPDDRNAQDIDGESVGPEGLQLQGRRVADRDADEKTPGADTGKAWAPDLYRLAEISRQGPLAAVAEKVRAIEDQLTERATSPWT